MVFPRRRLPDVRVSPTMQEVQEEAAAFREESGLLRDALKDLRVDIAETLEEIEQFSAVVRQEDPTSDRHPHEPDDTPSV